MVKFFIRRTDNHEMPQLKFREFMEGIDNG